MKTLTLKKNLPNGTIIFTKNLDSQKRLELLPFSIRMIDPGMFGTKQKDIDCYAKTTLGHSIRYYLRCRNFCDRLTRENYRASSPPPPALHLTSTIRYPRLIL